MRLELQVIGAELRQWVRNAIPGLLWSVVALACAGLWGKSHRLPRWTQEISYFSGTLLFGLILLDTARVFGDNVNQHSFVLLWALVAGAMCVVHLSSGRFIVVDRDVGVFPRLQ